MIIKIDHSWRLFSDSLPNTAVPRVIPLVVLAAGW